MMNCGAAYAGFKEGAHPGGIRFRHMVLHARAMDPFLMDGDHGSRKGVASQVCTIGICPEILARQGGMRSVRASGP